jgi:hypothetical protein
MSFNKRHLKYVIQLNSGSFDSGSNALTVQGIRSIASIQTSQGGLSPFVGRGLFQLFGMNPADMAKLSTLGLDIARINKNTVQVFAYNEGNESSAAQVFAGYITNARLNYNAMPDVLLEIDCWGNGNQQTQMITGTSVPASGDVAAMLKVICAACDPPVTFINNGIHANLANHAVGGSAFDQINDICCAVPGLAYTLQGGVLTIWDGNKNIDGVTIDVGPDNGMVGYPEYSQMGFDITAQFTPEIQVGRWVNLKPSSTANTPPIPGVPGGPYFIRMVEHELSSELPDGPWFTHAHLSALATPVRS